VNWTANGQTFAALGITGATLSRATWGPHTCRLTASGRDATVPALFADGASVTIKHGETVRFVGEVKGAARAAEGGAEGHVYELVNAWIALEETIYRQPWVKHSGSVNLGRCIVGLKADGTIGTLGEAIADVLAAAGVAAGTISLAATDEPWEVRNVMCSEVIKQIARLRPRAVSWWTYPAGVPTFNVSDAPATGALAFTPDTDAVDLRPNRSQAVRGVVLQYEVARVVDDEQVLDIVLDTAGETTGRRVLLQTIPWRGASEKHLRQRVKVRSIPLVPTGTDAQMKATRKFWASRVPELRTAKPVTGDADKTPEITFLPFLPAVAGAGDNTRGQQPADTVGVGPTSGGRYYFAVQLAHKDGGDGATQWELEDSSDEDSDHIVLDTTLPRYLIEGAVTPWMRDQGCEAQRWTMHAFVTFLGKGAPGFMGRMVHINVTATDCTNREYSHLQDYADGDPVPSGIAAELYAALGQTHHEGTVRRVADECDGAVREGQKLTISGGATEWSTMHALVQKVDEQIATGTTTITVGVGEHLAPPDMIELIRRERKRAEADTGLGVANSASKLDGRP
jgi:hypothetical protein